MQLFELVADDKSNTIRRGGRANQGLARKKAIVRRKVSDPLYGDGQSKAFEFWDQPTKGSWKKSTNVCTHGSDASSVEKILGDTQETRFWEQDDFHWSMQAKPGKVKNNSSLQIQVEAPSVHITAVTSKERVVIFDSGNIHFTLLEDMEDISQFGTVIQMVDAPVMMSDASSWVFPFGQSGDVPVFLTDDLSERQKLILYLVNNLLLSGIELTEPTLHRFAYLSDKQWWQIKGRDPIYGGFEKTHFGPISDCLWQEVKVLREKSLITIRDCIINLTTEARKMVDDASVEMLSEELREWLPVDIVISDVYPLSEILDLDIGCVISFGDKVVEE